MTFLFVDHIQSVSLEYPIQGIRTVTDKEPYLVKQDDGSLIFMPSLIAEAIGQLGAWAVMNACNFKYRPVAGVVSAVTLLGEAKPGDTLQLTTRIDSMEEDKIEYHGEACVNGKQIVKMDSALGPMLPMHEFIDENVVRAQFDAIRQTSPKLTEHPPSEPVPFQASEFDTILSFEQDKPVLAEKTVVSSLPFLKDHFPNKPVLPLSVLLNAKLALAIQYVNEYLTFPYEKIVVRKIKMSHFVSPGETVSTEMKLKNRNDRETVFSFRTFASGKRVCVCEAVFII